MTSRHLPLYWINLEGSIDRRESLLQELQRAGVRDHTRVPAISPSDLSSFEIISAPGTPALLPTEWACTLSHLTAVRTALCRGDEAALILEDDVRVLRSPVTPIAWKNLRDSLASSPWQVLQLLCFGDAAIDFMTDASAPPWVPWRSGSWCTAAYVINRSGMLALLSAYAPDMLLPQPLPQPCVVDFFHMPLCSSGHTTPDPRARCVADWVVFVSLTTLCCTDVLFTETARDSTIKPTELSLHNETIQTIRRQHDTKRYKLSLDQPV